MIKEHERWEIKILSFHLEKKLSFELFSVSLFFQAGSHHAGGSYSTIERGLCKKRGREWGWERDGRMDGLPPSLPLPTPQHPPRGGMPVSLLLSNLQEWKDRVCSSSSSKEAYKYRREKNRREKFVLGEILTAPKRKISIKWSCRTTSIIHTHSGGQPRTLTLWEGRREWEREREKICKSFLIYSII